MKDLFILTTHAREQIILREIPEEWIERVLSNPCLIEPDKEDPELQHALDVIPEYDNRVLRVIYNKTTTPWRVVSVFFDRRMKGKL